MPRPPGVVTIFTTTTCPHCRAAKALLGTKDVNLVIWEVDLYPPEVREELSLRAGGAKSVPQIFLNDKHLPGGNSNLQELEKEGKLDGLLAESLADPPGPAVPTVTAEKIKNIEPSVQAVGIGGLPRSDDQEKKLRTVIEGLRASGIKGKFRGSDILGWLKKHHVDPQVADSLLKYGVIKATAGSARSFSESGKYLFAADEDPNILNMQFDASVVPGLSAKRPAEEVVTLLRKQILSLYQTFLSKDGSSVNYAGIRQSKEFEAYIDTATELQLITIEDLENFSEQARRAFFINLYNALAIHGFAQFGHATSSAGRLRFFNSTSYRMGGFNWSLNLIEHGILRSNKPSPAGVFPLFRGWMLSSLPLIDSHDKRTKCIMKELDPRIHFALNCGAKSCPPIKLFSGDNLDSELLLAAQAFCEDDSNVHVDTATMSVRLSMILKWYSKDFGKDDKAVCTRLLPFLNGEKKIALEEVLKAGRFSLLYTPYDWGENNKAD